MNDRNFDCGIASSQDWDGDRESSWHRIYGERSHPNPLPIIPRWPTPDEWFAELIDAAKAKHPEAFRKET